MKRARKELNFEIKIQILDEISRGVKQTLIAKKYGVPESTISTIKANKDKIYSAAAAGNIRSNSKRLRGAKHADVEDELLKWFNHQRSSNVPISGPILQEKARMIAASLNLKDFQCSDGWLWRFQQRNNLSAQFVCGELNKVPEESANAWLKSFEEIKMQYSPRDIFNIDESGIFFNLFPNRTLHIKGEKCHGGTLSKQRITAVFTCNSDGSEKLKPWIIGKSENPRAFKNKDRTKFRCTYSSQKNAWVDTPAFRKYLLQFNDKMASQHRKVLLTMDNCRAHDITNLNLSSVRVIFFPPNMTSRLQPLDQGIIRVVKSHYRKRLVKSAIQAIESGKEHSNWNVLDAVRAVGASWDEVSPDIIKNCFMKAWRQSDEDRDYLEVCINEGGEEWEYLKSIDPQIQVGS